MNNNDKKDLPVRSATLFPEKTVSDIVKRLEEGGLEKVSEKEIVFLSLVSLNQSFNKLNDSVSDLVRAVKFLCITVWFVLIVLIVKLIFKF